MTIEEYQSKVPQTINYHGDERDELHFTCGIFTELGELLDPYKKNFCRTEPKPIDMVNFKEEIGDIAFYCNALSILYNAPIDIIRLTGVTSERDIAELLMSAMSCYNMVLMGQIPKERYPGLVMSGMAQICEYYGVTLEECYDINITKLHGVRYKNGYSDEAMDNRDVSEEYKIMNAR